MRVRVANAGDRAGEEVVQLYGAWADADGAPRQSLAGFMRIGLKAGEARDIEFEIPARALIVVTVDGSRSGPARAGKIWVDGGQSNLGATAWPQARGSN